MAAKTICLTLSALPEALELALAELELAAELELELELAAELELDAELEHPAMPSRPAATTVAPSPFAVRKL